MTAPAIEGPIVPIRTFEQAFRNLLADFGVTVSFPTDESEQCAPALLAYVASVYGATTLRMSEETAATYSLYRQWVTPTSPAELEWLSGVAS